MRTTHVLASPPVSSTTVRRQQRRAVVALVVALIALVVALVLVVANGSRSLAEIAGGAGQPIASDTGSVLTPEHGYIGSGNELSVFDEQASAVTRLNPDLLDALRRAAADAAMSGVDFKVNGGWRSAALQEKMLQDAIVEYDSEEEARRWVASAETSEHVSGAAVDLGPWSALDWLAINGSRYGLCQIYNNEPWHYELRPEAVDHGCPAMFADPTEDPRMQQ